jgi:P27 family predicted phage terminase small subunit
MGRPPIPIPEHKRNGTFRRDRHRAMPLCPTQKPPRPPAWLSPAAKTKWKEAAKQLAELGVLTALDLDALAGFCESFSLWRAAVEIIMKEGMTYMAGSGQHKPHPAVGIMINADKAMRDWAGRLGLHVEARCRLRIDPAAAERQAHGVASRNRDAAPKPYRPETA